MNLLTIAATFGVLVAVSPVGWLSGLIGMDTKVSCRSSPCVGVRVIVFGLSMDYEVFLMSRMQEEYLSTGDPSDAVERSLGTTGRVIISAALVMFAVFVSFVSNPSPMVKQIGLGLAVGVLGRRAHRADAAGALADAADAQGRLVDTALAGCDHAEHQHRGRDRELRVR
ncbi:MAG: MMPL family transporter [Microthrixaceae bacterium]